MRCNKCGNELSDETIVCPFCGTPVEDFDLEKTEEVYADQEENESKEDNYDESVEESEPVEPEVNEEHRKKKEHQEEQNDFETKEIKYKKNIWVSLVSVCLTVVFLYGTYLVAYRIPFTHDKIIFVKEYAAETFGFPTNDEKPIYEATDAEWTFTGSDNNYTYASSSSYVNSNGQELGPTLIADNNAATTWFEGVPDDGAGQIIAMTYNGKSNKKVKEIYFIVGSTRSIESFNRNGVPTQLQIYVDGKEKCTANLQAIPNPQKISLKYPITLKTGTKVEFVIRNVYVGPENVDHDTGISEIRMV